MRKFILMTIVAFSAMFANAQTAVEESKVLDNAYVGAEVGVATPLSFDNVFPLNTTFGLHVGKWFTPVVGAEIEGTAWFGSHSTYGFGNRFDGTSHNAIRGTYVGLNSLVNITNALQGYNGRPRFFEVNTLVGLGWLHAYTPGVNNEYSNDLGLKTGLDFAFNLGKEKAHTISVRPAVLWNLSTPGNANNGLAFNKNGAQLFIGVGYTYHFKTSNGTRHFKTYNIASYESTIARLNDELAKKPKEVIVEKVIIKEVPVQVADSGYVSKDAFVFFAKNSDVLTDNAKAVLDKVTGSVKISAYASPEGSAEYNQKLSQRRADAVAKYLTDKGVTVIEAVGCGVDGDASNRVGIVTVQ